ncbi:sensor domain-containing diguanylate cyclase [Agarivorans gilvus]|uniref:Sensor domain-containing diguanylate cyclase n=2 Tax=Agarivorans gilvus TaxID=680279 RepID=A0ABQ1I681_9ALTE|nr:sensor domain-containing diguanylate cyclase [Agarivorans gilvus]
MFKGLQQKANLMFALSSMLYFVLAALSIQLVSQFFVGNEVQKVEAELGRNLAITRANLEAIIFQDTYLADSLATVVTLDQDLASSHWKTIAQKLLNKAQFVRSIGIAPNNIISKVYPLEGNEGAIGLDFRTQPKQLIGVNKARELMDVYIDGPVNLVQGGLGLIARYPIFSDAPKNQHYWGTVSVVMDYNKMLKGSGLEGLSGLDVALRKQHNGQAGEVFYGSAAVFTKPDLEHIIRLPSGTWLLAAKFDTAELNHIQNTRQLSLVLGLVVTIAVYLLLVLHFLNYKQIHKASLVDELTQLPNRRFVMNQLHELTNKNQNKPGFALLNIDLNGFKKVNDQIGHNAGDELLKHVSNQLLASVRQSDTVARFGGDEFVVLLKDVHNSESAKHIIGKIKQQVESQVLNWQGQSIVASLSIGFALYPEQVDSIEQLLSYADKNMYQQKIQHKAQQATH